MYLMAMIVRELESFRDEHVFLGRQGRSILRLQGWQNAHLFQVILKLLI